MKKNILNRIRNKELIVGVVGLGYVGLPLAVEKAKAGFRTVGFDVQNEKVDMVNHAQNYINDVIDNELEEVVNSGMLKATNEFDFIRNMDFIAICVPTPLDAHQQPDISYVKSAAELVASYLKKESIVVLESTTYPGTTEELLKNILEEKSGLKCGRDFYLGYSPERVDPGNIIYHTKNTPKVVSGIGEDATEVIAEMYRAVIDGEVHVVSSPSVAEMEKILENTYRNINIGLVNELTILCNRMGISIWEVIDAAKTKPYGFQAFYPGPGLGGHCIPLDPYYLSWRAREYGFHVSMIESSMMINDKMPEYCVERIEKILNREKKTLNGSNLLVLGVAYKQNINDYRESPALHIIDILEKYQANVEYYDPWVDEYIFKGERKCSLSELNPEKIASFDLVIITTAHSDFDYTMIQKNAKMIFDTRNAMKGITIRNNIELL